MASKSLIMPYKADHGAIRHTKPGPRLQSPLLLDAPAKNGFKIGCSEQHLQVDPTEQRLIVSSQFCVDVTAPAPLGILNALKVIDWLGKRRDRLRPSADAPALEYHQARIG